MGLIRLIKRLFKAEEKCEEPAPKADDMEAGFADVQRQLDQFTTVVRRFDETTHNGLQDLAHKAKTTRVTRQKPATT